MTFKMAPNSLFAVLLRNPWWISFLIAIVISAICAVFLPKHLGLLGVMGALPFWITGAVALKRQWSAPSAAQVQAEIARVSGLSWRDFANELVTKFEKKGFLVERFSDKATKQEGAREGAADFKLVKNGQTTLVAAKRYKAATHGVEALQALVAQQAALGADRAMYVCLSGLTEQAATFAKESGVTVGWVSA
jgi:restriction system protein